MRDLLFQFFVGKLAYEEALKDVKPSQQGVVNILASTGALFTLILTAMFPSNNGDRFTLSKLVAVALRYVPVAAFRLQFLGYLNSEIKVTCLSSKFP